MNKPKNYVKNGTTYQDQLYDEYVKMLKTDTVFPKEYAWDKCLEVSERIHNERIRNIIQPIYNLICYLSTKNTYSEAEQKEIENLLFNEKSINAYNICINRLLNIVEQ